MYYVYEHNLNPIFPYLQEDLIVDSAYLIFSLNTWWKHEMVILFTIISKHAVKLNSFRSLELISKSRK